MEPCDPASTLGDLDLHLLGEGTHLRAYEKLGAHPRQLGGVDGVSFAVWAPNAQSVSVVGDFNGWDGRCHPLRQPGSNGFWETFVPGVGVGALYKFQIHGPEGNLLPLKADPFAFRCEAAPGTASIVHGLQDHPWGDGAWLEARRRTRTHEAPVSIYELHLGSWRRRPDGSYMTYGEIAADLAPYVSWLGFTHVQLLPIMEHPFDPSWGYQPLGLFAPTSRFGGPEDFKCFVDTLHQAGLGVILDWVPAHFPEDSHGLGQFDGTHLYEHADPRQGRHMDWGTLIFNFGRTEVQNFLIANALFWLDRYHIDGLRVDAVASMLYLDYSREEGQWIPNRHGGRENLEAVAFLRRFNEVVYGHFPDACTIAEESTAWPAVSRPTDQGGLGFGFKWDMGWMHDTLRYLAQGMMARPHHHDQITFSMLYHDSENYVLPLSHDEVVHGKRSLLAKMPGDEWQQFANLRLLFFYLWSHPGKKILFMGGEFGQLSEWYCKASLDWHLVEERPLHRQLQTFVKTLNTFYKEHPALWQEDHSYNGFQWLDFKDVNNSIISFARKASDPKDHLVCLLNFTPQVHYNYKLGVLADVPHRLVLSSDSAQFGGGDIDNSGLKMPIHEPFGEAPMHITITVPPLGGVIFKPER